MNTPCITWCTILRPLSTLWVHNAQYGAEFSHLWVPYEYIMHNMVQNCHTSEHLKSTLYTIWCRIVTSLSTVWVHHAQYGAKLSHLWASSEYIMQNMVQNCHILRASYEYIMRRMFTPPSTLWIHHAPYGAEFSTIVDATQRTKKQTKAYVSEITRLRLQYICKLRFNVGFVTGLLNRIQHADRYKLDQLALVEKTHWTFCYQVLQSTFQTVWWVWRSLPLESVYLTLWPVSWSSETVSLTFGVFVVSPSDVSTWRLVPTVFVIRDGIRLTFFVLVY